MTDKPPRERIDIHDSASRARWAERFGLSQTDLKAAVRRFGTVPATVRAALGLPPG